MRGEIIEFFIMKQIKKPRLTVLCSVVKHAGSGRTLKKWGKTLSLPACFATEQSTVEASLFVNYGLCLFFNWICFPSGLSPTTLQALAKLVNAHAVNTALVALVSDS